MKIKELKKKIGLNFNKVTVDAKSLYTKEEYNVDDAPKA